LLFFFFFSPLPRTFQIPFFSYSVRAGRLFHVEGTPPLARGFRCGNAVNDAPAFFFLPASCGPPGPSPFFSPPAANFLYEGLLPEGMEATAFPFALSNSETRAASNEDVIRPRLASLPFFFLKIRPLLPLFLFQDRLFSPFPPQSARGKASPARISRPPPAHSSRERRSRGNFFFYQQSPLGAHSPPVYL